MNSAGSLVHPLRGADRERRAEAERWLLRAAECAYEAACEWAEQGVTLLTTGVVWDVVRAPYRLLDPAFDCRTGSDALRRRLTRAGVSGAVFCDSYRPALYFLVPPDTDRKWPNTLAAAGVQCFGGSRPYVHHVGVPSLGRALPPGPYWLLSPDNGGIRHVDPEHLYRSLCAYHDAQLADGTKPGAS
ncbi:hypothetical protein OG352_39020 [Streptomyces sp. NBC_01485]|uniref:hypothetical protein n=1 Tax=Streptomyces sp. NBC_01485 TaxID=2903884 RepID=UPI002E36824B|nr:hypothetical protein [Streptomyces sp. NBC_01485]